MAGLPIGTTYDVYVTYAGKIKYSMAAPYAVNGGTAVKINQSILVTQSQGGLTQGTYGDVGWLALGTYADSSTGTLQVVLSNLTTGNSVDADAVLIVPHGKADVIARPAVSPVGGALVGTSMGTIPTNGTNGGQTTGAPTIAIGDVTQVAPVTVVQNSGPRAQGSTPALGIVDLAIGSLTEEGGTTTKKGQSRRQAD
jgi:hypothetical protein